MAFKGWKTTENLTVTHDNGYGIVAAQQTCAALASVSGQTASSEHEPVVHTNVTPTQVSNKKVKGAMRVQVDGIHFDSKLEAAVYRALRDSGLVFDIQVKFILLESFVFNGEIIAPWTHKVDFVVYVQSLRLVVEVKGWPNDVYPYKLKMLRRWLATEALQGGMQSYILFVHTQKEILPFIGLLEQLQTEATALETLKTLYSHPESEAIRKRKKVHASTTHKNPCCDGTQI